MNLHCSIGFTALVIIASCSVSVNGSSSADDPGLGFIRLPPNRVNFANTRGATIECAAEGVPPPKIEWILADGNRVTDVPGIRQVDSSGNLKFPAFRPEQFRPDVHTGVYRCLATNNDGSIQSPDIRVQGVVIQSHDVQVYDTYAIEGNTAVFKCHIPSVLKDHMKVVAWIKNENHLIETKEEASGKYAIMPTGELHVRNVEMSESGSKYKCKAMLELTGDVQTSASAGQMFVTESRGRMPPKILDSPSFAKVYQGEDAILQCVTQGNPAPSVKWYKKTASNQLQELNAGNTMLITKSSLVIKNVKPNDEGIYVCEVTSENANEHLDINLNVAVNLTATIRPPLQKAKVGDTITMECDVVGRPIDSVTWLHNGQVRSGSQGNVLKINDMQMSDRGYYQCVAQNSEQMVQSAAKLEITESRPYFVETFKEAILNPGEALNLQCTASGMPTPQIVWNIDGILLNKTAKIIISTKADKFGNQIGELKIERTVTEDGGIYGCEATNENGKSEHSAKINIYGNLGARKVEPKVVVSGTTMHLNCPIYGHPVEKITWKKMGSILPDSLGQRLFRNGTLMTEHIDRKFGSGAYNCFARDSKGNTVEATVDVQVMVAPKIVPFGFGNHKAEGTSVRVVCGLEEGDPPIQFSWMHNGSPVISDGILSIHEVDGLSSILSIVKLSLSNAGNYTCNAKNKAGQTQHIAVLQVNVPPKIVPFSFQEEHLVEGQLARVSCVISRGDLPIKLQWKKDGVEIQNGVQGVQIKSFDEHSSIMSIQSVSSKHNGQYTCIGTNGAGSARHSAQLVVLVPPDWIMKPKDMSVLRTSTVYIHCQVKGFPQPNVEWKQLSGTDDEQGASKTLQNNDNIRIFPNGTLLIQKVMEKDEGHYLCSASNGVGRGIGSRLQLSINAPPIFKHTEKQVKSGTDRETELQCVVQGNTPIKIVWYRDGTIIQDGQNKHKIQTTNTASDAVSILTIHKVARSDNGNYECSAENSYGINKTVIDLLVMESPDSPKNFKVTSAGSRTVELQWETPYNGNDAIKKYLIQYKMSSGTWDDATMMETVNGDPTNSIVTQLHPNTRYIFRIFAENGQGRSPASPLLQITTSEDVPSGPPLSVKVESINTETFKVTWKSPEQAHWNGVLLGYYVGYKEAGTTDPYLYKTLVATEPNKELSVMIGGLKQFTKYTVIVQAYNSQGKGPDSQSVIIMTSEGAPSLPPTDVRCTTLTSQSVHVTWTAPPSDSINGILSGYKVAYKPVSDWLEDLAENFNVTLAASMTLNGLEKFSNISVQVSATTRAGEGIRSSPIFCRTLDDVPGAPNDIKAFATSDGSVTVAWKPPQQPNGLLRIYTIHWREASNPKVTTTHTVAAQISSYEVTQLKKDVSYEFWVTASTVVGEGEASRIIRQIPSGPTTPAKIISFENKIVTPLKSTINLPCDAVGLPEPQRQWFAKGKSVQEDAKLQVLQNGVLSIRDLLEVDAGDYQCVVQNDYGTDKITFTLIVLGPPTAPVFEIKSTSSSSIEILWRAPTSKMSRIKGYTLHMRKDGGEWRETTVGPDVRSYQANNLECGTRYEIYLSAFNKIGIGAQSEILMTSTNGSAPNAPKIKDLLEQSSNSATIHLNSWKSDSCPILYFVAEYAPKSSSEWTLVSNTITPEQRRVAVSGLKSATWYELRMTAHSSAGSTVAKYDFATLTLGGATITPDIQADRPQENVDSIMATLNFYIVVPIICTVVILLAIFGMACMCVKIKRQDQRNNQGNRISISSGTELKRGNSSESFAYMQRACGTMNRQSTASRLMQDDDNLTPYATFPLAGQEFYRTLRRPNGSPHLIPIRIEGYPADGVQIYNQQFIPHDACFIPHHGQFETTFTFPSPPNDGVMQPTTNFPPEFPPPPPPEEIVDLK